MNKQELENQQRIPKVLFKKQLSTKVECTTTQHPQWIDDTHICYGSAYQFINYNIDDQSISIVNRPENQSKVLALAFYKQFNYSGIQVLYIIKQQDNCYYLCIVPSLHPFKKQIGSKHLQKNIQSIHSLIKLQGTTVLIHATIKNKKSILFTNLTLQHAQVFTREKDIIKIMEIKTPGYICIQTQDQLILAKFQSDTLNIQFLSFYSLNPGAIVEILTDYSNNYAAIFYQRQVLIVPFDTKRFLKPNKNYIDVQQIGGVNTNLKSIIVWEKNLPILYQFHLEEERVSFKNKIELQLRNSKIEKIIFSEKNRNVLIVSKNNGYLSDILIFKLDLYTQLSMTEPQVYLRSLKYIYKQKRVHSLSHSQVGSNLYALTGLTIHNLTNSLLDGILSFDIHPLGLYMLVSFGFSAKVYSLENSNISLIFSCSMQNIKKVKYSPSGADILLFSSRLIKVIDAYSFTLKHQINEKMNSYIDFCYGYSGQFIYALAQSGTVYCYNSYDYKKIDASRNYSTEKIVQVKVDERTQRQCLLTEKGGIIFRNRISNLKIYEYQNQQRVTAFQIDHRNGVIFIGTQSGKLKAHLWPLQSLQARDEDQIRICYSQITCIQINNRRKIVYVGSNCGNISIFKYKVRNSDSDYLMNEQSDYNQKIQGLQRYVLCSNLGQGNSQQNILQSKLEQVINKINEQMKNFKISFKEQFKKKQQKLSVQTDNHSVYATNKQRIHAIQRQLDKIQQNFYQDKQQLENNYQQQIKAISVQQEALRARKFLLISLHHMAKKCIKNKNVQNQQQLQKQCDQAAQFKNKMVQKADIQRKLFHIQQDFIPQVDNITYRNLNNKLTSQLRLQKEKCFQLRKQFIYLKTAKSNILDRKIKQQTLEHKIVRQIDGMKETKNFHQLNTFEIKKDLAETQKVIEKIENQVKPSNSNKKSQSKAKTDICSYKVYMKNKVTNQLDLLRDHLTALDEQLQVKWLDLVSQITLKQKNDNQICQLKQDLEKLKKALKEKRNQKISLQYKIKSSPMSITWNSSFQNTPNVSDFSIQKAIKGKDTFTEMIQKSNHFLNNNIKVGKRKIYKLNKQNTTLLNQYLRLKYQNKKYVDKQNLLLEKLSCAYDQLNNTSLVWNLDFSKTQRKIQKKTETPFKKYIKQKNIKTHRSLRITPKTSPISTPFRV